MLTNKFLIIKNFVNTGTVFLNMRIYSSKHLFKVNVVHICVFVSRDSRQILPALISRESHSVYTVAVIALTEWSTLHGTHCCSFNLYIHHQDTAIILTFYLFLLICYLPLLINGSKCILFILFQFLDLPVVCLHPCLC